MKLSEDGDLSGGEIHVAFEKPLASFSIIHILECTPSQTSMRISSRTKLTILHHVVKNPLPSASFHSFASHSHQWKTQSSLGGTEPFRPPWKWSPLRKESSPPPCCASCDQKVARSVAAAGRRDPEMLMPAFPEDLVSCRKKRQICLNKASPNLYRKQ